MLASQSPESRTAVIIVNYNGGEDIIRCLQGVAAQTCQPARTIVVDNHSADGSADQIGELFPDVTLIRESDNTGFAAANNRGIQVARECDWIALLNPDAFPDPEWLGQLVDAISRYPEIEIFSSKLIDANNLERLDGTGDIYHASGLSWRRDHGAKIEAAEYRNSEVFSPCAAAALYKASLIESVRGFDPTYFCYHEDIDMAFRMRLVGADCRYIENSIAYHVGSGVTGKGSDFSVYHGHRNLVWTFFKNMPGWLLWMYLPQHLLLNLVTVVYYSFRGKSRLILKAKWDALKGLPFALRQRREIQANRTVPPSDIRKKMATGLFKPYISRHA